MQMGTGCSFLFSLPSAMCNIPFVIYNSPWTDTVGPITFFVIKSRLPWPSWFLPCLVDSQRSLSFPGMLLISFYESVLHQKVHQNANTNVFCRQFLVVGYLFKTAFAILQVFFILLSTSLGIVSLTGWLSARSYDRV